MNRDQLGYSATPQVGPDRLELRPIRESLLHLDGRIRFVVRPFKHQCSVLQAEDGLPFQDTTLFKALDCMLSNDVFLFRDELANCVKQLSQGKPSSC